MEIDSKAPVNHSDSIIINAPVERVWQIMSNIEKWPEWNPEIKWAKLNGKLAPGATFAWKAGPGKIRSTIEVVDTNKFLAWSGRTMGISAIHVWKMEADNGKTILTTEESWDGLLARIFKVQSKKTLEKAISSGLMLLKNEAEKL